MRAGAGKPRSRSRERRSRPAKLGVAPIEALGERFDPNRHEALIREENPRYPENTVIEVLREGYLYKDRLLRPAQVKVAVQPRKQDS
ncbi:MAG: nucleotide exchange factor GrpE [Acidobacteria bacterium]|nr:MAG: nucleotide exchange factor GrpE [Acidobacteriota bacterium]